MPITDNTEFEIKMVKQEHVKGPLAKATATASLANRLAFFFSFSLPSSSQPSRVTLIDPLRTKK